MLYFPNPNSYTFVKWHAYTSGTCKRMLFTPTPLETLDAVKTIICYMRVRAIDCAMIVPFRFGLKTCVAGENV